MPMTFGPKDLDIDIDEVPDITFIEDSIVQIAANPRRKQTQGNLDQLLPCSRKQKVHKDNHQRDDRSCCKIKGLARTYPERRAVVLCAYQI